MRYLNEWKAAWSWSLLLLALWLIFPDQALAGSATISEFSGPIDKVTNTLSGPIAQGVTIVGFLSLGIYFIINKEDLSGVAKSFLTLVIALCFVGFAIPIANNFFSFSGALI
jgi:type IV secretion system protein VirB2